MNIAVFVKASTFHSGYGGVGTQKKKLCEKLAGRGDNVTGFSPKKKLI